MHKKTKRLVLHSARRWWPLYTPRLDSTSFHTQCRSLVLATLRRSAFDCTSICKVWREAVINRGRHLLLLRLKTSAKEALIISYDCVFESREK